MVTEQGCDDWYDKPLVVSTFNDAMLSDVISQCNSIIDEISAIYDNIEEDTSIEEYNQKVSESNLMVKFANLEPWLRSFDLPESSLYQIIKDFDARKNE